MGSRRKGRVIAFQAIYAWDFCKNNIDNILKLPWLDNTKSNIEESIIFAKLIIAGTIENIKKIDEEILRHSDNWAFNRINKVDLAILRLSTYSLLFQKDIKGNIVIDEAIDISKEFSNDDSYRFINGVLDSIYKETGFSNGANQ